MKKNNTRFERKLDCFFWFIVSMLPVILYIVNAFNGAALDFFVFVKDNFTFNFIYDIFEDVLSTAFGSVSPITALISYFVSVELIHVLFDVAVLFTRIGRNLIDRVVNL